MSTTNAFIKRHSLSTYFALAFAISSVFLPGILTTSDKASLLLFGFAVGLGAGFFEELGWTGFAVPGLRLRHGVLGTGLIVGLLWGAWHFLVTLWGSGSSSGALSLVLFLFVALFSFLPPYRLLMVPYREPACGDAHARESHSQRADPWSSGDIRGSPLDL